MKILLIGDVHISDNPPSIRTSTYTQDILDKLEWIIDYGNKKKVDAVIQLGDVFHIKTPSRNSHKLVQRVAEVFEGSNVPVLIVPGNHDLQNDDLESIPNQPLGSLCLSPNISLLMGKHPTLNVLGVPYLHNWKDCSQYLDGLDDNTLLCTHAAIFPDNENPPYDHVSCTEYAEYTHAKYVAFGHIHDKMGVMKTKTATLCNNGAISRGSLHQETLKRKPTVTIFDGKKFTGVEVPHKPIEEVFNLHAKAIDMEVADRSKQFMDALGSVEVSGVTIESVIAAAKGRLPEEDLTTLEEILENV